MTPRGRNRKDPPPIPNLIPLIANDREAQQDPAYMQLHRRIEEALSVYPNLQGNPIHHLANAIDLNDIPTIERLAMMTASSNPEVSETAIDLLLSQAPSMLLPPLLVYLVEKGRMTAQLHEAISPIVEMWREITDSEDMAQVFAKMEAPGGPLEDLAITADTTLEDYIRKCGLMDENGRLIEIDEEESEDFLDDAGLLDAEDECLDDDLFVHDEYYDEEEEDFQPAAPMAPAAHGTLADPELRFQIFFHLRHMAAQGDEAERTAQALVHWYDETGDRHMMVRHWLSMGPEVSADAKLAALDRWLDQNPIPVLQLMRAECFAAGPNRARWMIQRLIDMPYPDAYAILRYFKRHRDPEIRKMAGQAIDTYLGRHNLTENMIPPTPGTFVAAYGAHSPQTGEIFLVHGQEMPDGHVVRSFAHINYWDQGLILYDVRGCSDQQEWFEMRHDCWPSPEGLDTPLSANTFAALVHNAILLSYERMYPLNMDYALYEILLPPPTGDPEADWNIPFGWDCGFCAKPIKVSPKHKQPLIAGHVAVCGRCARRKPQCAACNQPIPVPGALMRACDEQRPPGLFCDGCATEHHRKTGDIMVRIPLKPGHQNP